jgi:hypothetical protein
MYIASDPNEIEKKSGAPTSWKSHIAWTNPKHECFKHQGTKGRKLLSDRYYLFSDYYAVGEPIRTAWLTSDSLYEQFELIGNIDSNGHPDPTVVLPKGSLS